MSQDNPPVASVIVPALNAAGVLPACLGALRDQMQPHPGFEVIVVDDGSSDDTSNVAERLGARAERIPHTGRAAARNHGAKTARGPLLLFTDADCVPAPDWVTQMAAPFADPSVAGARGVYRTRQRSLVARFVQLEYEDKYRPLQPLQDIDFVDTYSAAYRRDVFLEHGGFDPTMQWDEDQELSFRLANRGLRLVFAPEAAVYHQHPTSLPAYIRKKFGTGYWKAAVILTHPNKLARDTHTPPSQRAQLLLTYATLALCIPALFGAISFWFPAGAAVALTVTMLPFAWRAARKNIAVALISPALLWARTVGLGAGFALGLLWFLPRKFLGRSARP